MLFARKIIRMRRKIIREAEGTTVVPEKRLVNKLALICYNVWSDTNIIISNLTLLDLKYRALSLIVEVCR
jgi:hypothetical protein